MTLPVGLMNCLDYGSLGLEIDASSVGLETDAYDEALAGLFATVLEPLTKEPTPAEQEPDMEPDPNLQGVWMVPVGLSVPNAPLPNEGAGTESFSASHTAHALLTAPFREWFALPFPSLNPQQSAEESVLSSDLPLSERTEGVPLPEGMEWFSDQSKSFHLNPQESATGVSETLNLASPARKEAPLTPSLPSEAEQLLGTALQTAPREMAPQIDERETEPKRLSEPQPRAELAGHPLWNHTVSAEMIEVSSTLVGSQHDSLAVVKQVADHLERLVAHQERSRIQFRLDPPELGTVEIRIEVQGNSVQAWLMADQETTRHALNQHAQHLRDQLAERGLNLTQFEVGYGSSQSFAEQQARSAFANTVPNQPISRPRMAMESLQRVAYNPNGQWSVWA